MKTETNRYDSAKNVNYIMRRVICILSVGDFKEEEEEIIITFKWTGIN
jgi:hypothetical protein